MRQPLDGTELVSWRNQDSNPRLPPQASRRALLPFAECSRALAKLWLLFPLWQPSRVGVATGEQARKGKRGAQGVAELGFEPRSKLLSSEKLKTTSRDTMPCTRPCLS